MFHVGNEHYIHAALENAADKQPPPRRRRTEPDAETEYDNARERDGVGSHELGIGSILNNTNVIIVGFFTSFVYSRLVSVLNVSKTWQLALISMSVTWMLLAVEKLYLYTLGRATWMMARTWSSIFRQFLRFFTLLMVFLTANFGFAVFTQQVKMSDLNWGEAIALIYSTVLLLLYLLRAFDTVEL